MFKCRISTLCLRKALNLLQEDDDEASNEQFIDNDKGEELHLKKLTEKEAAENQNDQDDTQEESSSRK